MVQCEINVGCGKEKYMGIPLLVSTSRYNIRYYVVKNVRKLLSIHRANFLCQPGIATILKSPYETTPNLLCRTSSYLSKLTKSFMLLKLSFFYKERRVHLLVVGKIFKYNKVDDLVQQELKPQYYIVFILI